MRLEQLNKVVDTQLQYCAALLATKGNEYALSADRLKAFKKAAALQDITPKQALLGMLSKHLVSISDMCTGPASELYSQERWTEKITDSINYLLLLRALVEEELGGE